MRCFQSPMAVDNISCKKVNICAVKTNNIRWAFTQKGGQYIQLDAFPPTSHNQHRVQLTAFNALTSAFWCPPSPSLKSSQHPLGASKGPVQHVPGHQQLFPLFCLHLISLRQCLQCMSYSMSLVRHHVAGRNYASNV